MITLKVVMVVMVGVGGGGPPERVRVVNLQPVARVGGEERAAEHQDAAQNIFLSHLERGLWGLSEA